MAFLTKEAFKRKTHTVDLKNGDQALIKELSGRRAVEFQVQMIDRKTGKPDYSKLPDFSPALIAESLVDESGNHFLSPEEAGDMPAPLSAELVEHINKVNNMMGDKEDDKGKSKES